jgi:MYXO-CTERM domain-containing protein
MRAPSLLLAAIIVVWAGPARAHDYLSCEDGLKLPDCTDVTGLWPVHVELHVAVKCQVCTGGGGPCTPQPVTASDLSLETGSGVSVSGSFSDAGSCSGVPLFKFSEMLAPSTSYHLLADIGSFGVTALIDFKTTGGGTVSDQGIHPKTDGGAGTDGAAPTTESGAPLATDAGGDAGSATDDGGCDCRISADDPGSSSPLLLLLLGALAARVVRRRPR